MNEKILSLLLSPHTIYQIYCIYTLRPRPTHFSRLQIIAMADSGLDQNSCFFREDSDADNIECSSYANPVYDLTKRKVRQAATKSCLLASEGSLPLMRENC